MGVNTRDVILKKSILVEAMVAWKQSCMAVKMKS